MNIKNLEKIEFSKICEILTSYCKTYIGKNFATNIEPLSTEKDIQKALDQTSEAVILLYRKGSVPINEIADITVSLKRLETLSSLSAKQLLDLGEKGAKQMIQVQKDALKMDALWIGTGGN